MSLQDRADEVTNRYQIPHVQVVSLRPDWTSNAGFYGRSSRRIYGQAVYHQRVILIRVSNRPDDEIRETLNHEIAHFIAFDLHGNQTHDRVWKKYAKALGACTGARRPYPTFSEQRAVEATKDEIRKAAKARRARARREARKLA